MDTKTLFVILLVAGILGGFSINTYMNDDVLENNIVDISVGSEAPDFTLTDTEGNKFNLSDYEGEKVVVLEFMSMSCGTCKNFEENALKSYCNETMPEDVEVISITQTKNADENELAERTDEMGWEFIKGKNDITDAFGAERSPTVVIIEKDGVITFLESGSMSQSELEDNINTALE